MAVSWVLRGLSEKGLPSSQGGASEGSVRDSDMQTLVGQEWHANDRGKGVVLKGLEPSTFANAASLQVNLQTYR